VLRPPCSCLWARYRKRYSRPHSSRGKGRTHITWYTFLLFVHIALAIAWIGGGLMMQFFGIRAILAGPERLAAFGADVEWIGMRVLTPASLLAFVSGILLVFEGPWSFGDDWIVIGLALFAVTFFAGMLFFGPESGRVGELIQSEGVESPDVQARMARLILFSRLDLVVLFLIVFDMAVKPEFADGGTIAFALAVAAAVAALIAWRSLAGRRPGEEAAAGTIGER
jgi:uncharacterized membrane protein